MFLLQFVFIFTRCCTPHNRRVTFAIQQLTIQFLSHWLFKFEAHTLLQYITKTQSLVTNSDSILYNTQTFECLHTHTVFFFLCYYYSCIPPPAYCFLRAQQISYCTAADWCLSLFTSLTHSSLQQRAFAYCIIFGLVTV